MSESALKVVLAGNPNSGKSSIFNLLTGLRQKVSNFPGVTVDKKQATFNLGKHMRISITDLPGCYSLFPNSSDERIVVDVLTNPNDILYPDLVIYVADSTQLERHLLLATQISDLGFPMIFVLNMMDIAESDGLDIDIRTLENFLQVPVIPFSGKTGQNIKELKNLMHTISQDRLNSGFRRLTPFINNFGKFTSLYEKIRNEFSLNNLYRSKLLAHHHLWMAGFTTQQKDKIRNFCVDAGFVDLSMQVEETLERFNVITYALKNNIKNDMVESDRLTDRLDSWVTNRWSGPLIFIVVMFLTFQAIFSWATYPMDWIDSFFAEAGSYFSKILPLGWFSDLLVNGVWAGLGGVVVFVPQIALLFLLISLLEESGYMSRAVFMFDGLMQKLGMNGRSVVSLISSGACAIPAIMSTRTISNARERLITILVSPFISCSARIPVYAILVAFVVPDERIWGLFNLQGIVFMSLYLLGILAALGVALLLKWILPESGRSNLMMELPVYKTPSLKNVWINVKSKVWSFITEAGKIIVMIAIALWFLASFGPGNNMILAESDAISLSAEQNLSEEETANLIAAHRIEASYAGLMGKGIEPVISPLGFDWKIGIAIITSFAAREVFVGTMATIYSIGSADDTSTLRQRMANETKSDGITPVFDLPTSLALLIFYVFALQCMSTLAVVRKETGTWKWPAIQFVLMGALAFLGAFLTYQLLS